MALTPNMSISVNGQCQVPPGFRFHPTEEELLQYYLRKKVSNQNIDLDVIHHVDLNKLEPWEIQEKCKIGTSPQNEWYLFSHKDKKYPSGSRTNRATAVGFWKATGRDKVIYSNAKRIGMRKTLVFYKGRAPHGQKSDWIMHEYRLDDSHTNTSAMGDRAEEEGWVVCRIFKKKHHHLATSIAGENGRSQMVGSCVEQLGRDYNDDKLSQLPSLESPKSMSQQNKNNNNNEVSFTLTQNLQLVDPIVNGGVSGTGGLTNWETLDRLVASQLNGQTDHEEAFRQFASFSFSTDPTVAYNYSGNGEQLLPTISSTTTHTSAASYSYITPTIQEQDYTSSDIHLWNFAPSACSFLSASEPLSHVFDTPTLKTQ